MNPKYLYTLRDQYCALGTCKAKTLNKAAELFKLEVAECFYFCGVLIDPKTKVRFGVTWEVLGNA